MATQQQLLTALVVILAIVGIYYMMPKSEGPMMPAKQGKQGMVGVNGRPVHQEGGVLGMPALTARGMNAISRPEAPAPVHDYIGPQQDHEEYVESRSIHLRAHADRDPMASLTGNPGLSSIRPKIRYHDDYDHDVTHFQESSLRRGAAKRLHGITTWGSECQ